MDLSEVRKLEEKQQLHELAEAIRRGCKIRKYQCHGSMFQQVGFDLRSCALGAAMDGLDGMEVDSAFPVLNSRYVSFPPPHINFCDDTLRHVVITLNDRCHWSRERIADWIDTL